MVSSGAYAAPSLLFIAVSFRVEMLRRGAAWVMSGIVIGLGASVVITRLLTGLLFGVSVTNIALAAGLFVNDRKNELGNRFYLMTVRPRHHLFDKLCDACRLNPCCHKRQQDYTSR